MGFFARFNYKSFGLTMILSLVLVTILNNLLASSISDFPIIKTGPAFFLLLISVFIIYLFVALSDGRIDKKEIWTMILIAGALVASGFILKNFFPSIFSVLPDQTKEVFSALGI